MICEKFVAKVRKLGNSLIITVPKKVAEYGGYEIGDKLRVLTQKTPPVGDGSSDQKKGDINEDEMQVHS